MTKFDRYRKRPKYDKKGNLIEKDTFYFTANLWFNTNKNFHVVKMVQDAAKEYIVPYLTDLPKFRKMRLTVIYHSPRDNWDLDNKAFFWAKIILDILKTPTARQLEKAWEKGYTINTLERIPDDSVKYVDKITKIYKRGPKEILELRFVGLEDQGPDQGVLFDDLPF